MVTWNDMKCTTGTGSSGVTIVVINLINLATVMSHTIVIKNKLVIEQRHVLVEC